MHAKLFIEETIAAGANKDSNEVGLHDFLTTHSVQYSITGDGTLTLSVYTKVGDSADWILSTSYSGLTKTSGPGSDGKNILPLTLKPGDLLKINAEETGSSEDVVLSLYFAQK